MAMKLSELPNEMELRKAFLLFS